MMFGELKGMARITQTLKNSDKFINLIDCYTGSYGLFPMKWNFSLSLSLILIWLFDIPLFYLFFKRSELVIAATLFLLCFS